MVVPGKMYFWQRIMSFHVTVLYEDNEAFPHLLLNATTFPWPLMGSSLSSHALHISEQKLFRSIRVFLSKTEVAQEVFLCERLPKEAINEEKVHTWQEFHLVQQGVLGLRGKEVTHYLLLTLGVGSKSFLALKCLLIRS